MHPISSLMLVESIQRERYEAARRPRMPSAPQPEAPSRPSTWSEMTRVYRLGFAATP
jgi:hypothetical protein